MSANVPIIRINSVVAANIRNTGAENKLFCLLWLPNIWNRLEWAGTNWLSHIQKFWKFWEILENLEFEVHVREPWKNWFYVTRSLFLIVKSRPKNRSMSITYHFWRQNLLRYFCMLRVCLAPPVLQSYLNMF